MRPVVRGTAIRPDGTGGARDGAKRTRSDRRQRLLPDERAGRGRADRARRRRSAARRIRFIRGKLGEFEVVFLSRHGRGHRILPSEMNFRANIYGMKQLGVDHLVSVSTAGQHEGGNPSGRPGGAGPVYRSYLQAAGDVLRRRYRRARFAGRSGVRGSRARSVRVAPATGGATVHDGGTYLCIEGPQFSTRAESNLYRSWGAT